MTGSAGLMSGIRTGKGFPAGIARLNESGCGTGGLFRTAGDLERSTGGNSLSDGAQLSSAVCRTGERVEGPQQRHAAHFVVCIAVLFGATLARQLGIDQQLELIETQRASDPDAVDDKARRRRQPQPFGERKIPVHLPFTAL
jgi:hypothetical protein